MTNKEELEKKQRLVSQILKRYNYEFTAESDFFRIKGGQLLFSDFRTPILYSLAGLILGILAYWSVGPLEGLVILLVTLLGIAYVVLLYRQKVNLSKTTFDIAGGGLAITNHQGEKQHIPPSAIQQLLIVLNPEDKIKTGELILESDQAGEQVLLKFVGENQKYIKDDLEKVREFMNVVFIG